MADQRTPWQDMQTELAAKAWKDEAFRRELIADPKTVIERETGARIPEGVAIDVHEETPTRLHLVLPAQPPIEGEGDLADEMLEHVAGGLASTVSGDGCTAGQHACTQGGWGC